MGQKIGKKDKDGLTPRQAAYCRERFKGKSQRQAYKDAGYSDKQSDDTLDQKACRLDKLDKIQARLAELRQMADKGAVMDRDAIVGQLSDMALDRDVAPRTRLQALDQLSKIQGLYIDKKQLDMTASVGLTREDRQKAMTDTLEALKRAWSDSDGKE